MEEKITMLGYDGQFGHEELMLEVGAYVHGKRLYIGLNHWDEGSIESFSNLTVNLPGYPLEANEAYINDLDSQSKLKFIRRHKLGKVLPERGYSGYVTYAKVAFDLDRLAIYDPKGVAEYRKLRGLENGPKVKETVADRAEAETSETEKSEADRTEVEKSETAKTEPRKAEDKMNGKIKKRPEDMGR